MFKNKQPNSSENRWNFKPLVYLNAFFHPVSRQVLRENLENADLAIKKADQTSAEYEALSREVRVDLERDTSLMP